MKTIIVKTLDGATVEAKNLKNIKQLLGDRIFIPQHCDPKTFDYNEYYKNIILKPKKEIRR